MDRSSIRTFRRHLPSAVRDEAPGSHPDDANAHAAAASSRCPHFAGFLSVCLAGDGELGLHPFATNVLPDFEDVTLGGGSFDVRRVKTSSFLTGLGGDVFKGRDFVVVKHPRASAGGDASANADCFADIATELQVLRHPPLRAHENIISLLHVMYHDAGEGAAPDGPRILPALILEYAEHGSLKAFQAMGHARSLPDQVRVALDAASGLQALHEAGMIHGDVKPSNFLVCRHAARGFVVKLADFGFSLSVEDGCLIGHSQMFCAPESYGGSLAREHLRQLDVYSYGLTLLTILDSGSTFYDNLPADGLEENVRKMKMSNLMCTLIPLRVLSNSRNDGLPMAILCKIFFYALQCAPAERFRDMNRIILLLRLVELITTPPQSDAASVAPETIPLAVDMVVNLTIGGGGAMSEPSGAIQQGYSDCFEAALEVLLALPGEDAVQMPLAECKALQNMCARLVQMLLYLDKLVTDSRQNPLGDALHQTLRKRAMAGLFASCGHPENKSGVVEFPTKKVFTFLADLIGLMPEPFVAGREDDPQGAEEAGLRESLHLSRYLDFIPDLHESYNIVRKMPWLVQIDAMRSLQEVYRNATDPAIKASAALNLSVAYTNGIGVDHDMAKAQDLMYQAAELGLEKAQTLFINVFAPSATAAELPEIDVWISWLKASASAGNPAALDRLETISTSSWSRISRDRKNEELGQAGIRLSEWDPPSLPLSAEVLSAPSLELLFWAIVEDHPDAVEACIRGRSDLLERQVGTVGEFPLLAACRLSRTSIAKLMIESQDDVALSDGSGVTPLHWLCSFPAGDVERMATLLQQKGAKVNATSVSLERSQYGVKVKAPTEPLICTPLHWAILSNNLPAVDALLKIGADPMFCADVEMGESTNMSPLELACRLCHSAVVSRLVQEPEVRQALQTPKPMMAGRPVMTRPLFTTLQGFSRWTRLVASGPSWSEEVRRTIATLVDNGSPTDAVLEVHGVKMPAVFAVAYHQCPAEVMMAGLQHGFANEIDLIPNKDGKGDNALFMAINHQDHAMVRALLDAGASTSVLDQHGTQPLERAAKESDDVFFARSILETGVPVNSTDTIGAFGMAVYSGNLTVARYLFDKGAERDRILPDHRTILGVMIQLHTRNSLERIKFLLSLPDRGGSDGFIVSYAPGKPMSALHLAALRGTQADSSAEQADITHIIVARLLEKYDSKDYIDSVDASDGTTALMAAAALGNHRVVKRLLEKGADPHMRDNKGRTALDLVRERHLHPEASLAFAQSEGGGAGMSAEMAARVLRKVKENTTELVVLLVSYGATGEEGGFPAWFRGEEDAGRS